MTYNLISDTRPDILHKFKELGHSISLHFDMLLYKNAKDEFQKEKEIFEHYFNTEVDIVSIHRPADNFLKTLKSFLVLKIHMKKSLQRIPNILLTLEDLLDLAIPQIQTLLKIIKIFNYLFIQCGGLLMEIML